MAIAAHRANLAAALDYAARDLPVFPVVMTGGRKVPITQHGYKDATRDPDQIKAWWLARPDALVSTPTGAVTGRVVLDVDVKHGVNGWHSLEDLGEPLAPQTPIAHTPNGGCHIHFLAPAWSVRCSAGKIGRGLDIRADGGSIILPAPTGGYWWDPHLYPDAVPLAPMPQWLIEATRPAPERIEARAPDYLTPGLSRYGRAALDGAGKDIMAAPAGQQEMTLNNKAFWIGQLVAAGEIPLGLARDALIYAASKMPNYDANNCWQLDEITKKIINSVGSGSQRPANLQKECRYA